MPGPVIRFRRSSLHLVTIEVHDDETILETARRAGLNVPSNCTSGTCGTCMMRLVSGCVSGLTPLPPGLDDDLVAEGAILTCIGRVEESSEIDVIPPL
ncbi:MAG: 2Fe-2S iron-sulfur cluster binding domain-containing protein [Candidatus Thalassarchaeaceae archaeon]|jgi:ferredoxin|nr:2Fe-2S iron-sulfur cluster binding domain-containing protein [Candidatus Thalassarchaeaceae archaeon]